MRSFIFSYLKISPMVFIFIGGLFILMFWAGIAQSFDNLVSESATPSVNNIIGNFEDEFLAERVAKKLNEGYYKETVIIAKVEKVSDFSFNVVTELNTSVNNSIVGGCTLIADPPVVRKNQEVKLSWKINKEIADCEIGINGCGNLSKMQLQGHDVTDNPVTVTTPNSTIYRFNASVTTGMLIRGEDETELSNDVVCTAKVTVVKFVPWFLWRFFAIQP